MPSEKKNRKPVYRTPEAIPLGELMQGAGRGACVDGTSADPNCITGTIVSLRCHAGIAPQEGPRKRRPKGFKN